MLKKILIVAAVVVAVPVVGVLGYAATKPDTFRIERSATIQAPPERIYAFVDDFRAWEAWSPYEKMDPAMKRTYSGAAHGQGARYAWEGNEHAGAGNMAITEAVPGEQIAIRLNFTKPFEASNTAEFTFKPEGGATKVTWAMHGPMPYISKVMDVLLGMDAMIGKDFEAGLASLKALAEKQSAEPASTAELAH